MTEPTKEYKRVDKPHLSKTVFVNAVVRSYQNSFEKKSVWGWYLFDWLESKGVIKIEEDEMLIAMAQNKFNLDKTKTELMNTLIQTERVTFEMIKETLC